MLEVHQLSQPKRFWRRIFVPLLVIFLVLAETGTAQSTNLGPDVRDWSPWGPFNQFGVNIDSNQTLHGKTSLRITSQTKAKNDDVVGVYQEFKSNDFRGKRIRFSGYITTTGEDQWSGLWMTVEDPNGAGVAFDNMQNRPIKQGTSWKKCSIVLDVPEDSSAIMIGCALHGSGVAWLSNLSLETVGKNIKTTAIPVDETKYPVSGRFNEKPTLTFSNRKKTTSDDDFPLTSWGIHSTTDYTIRADDNNRFEGAASGCLSAKKEDPKGFSTIYQTVRARDYRRKKIRFSAYAKTKDVEDWTGLWMRVDGGGQVLSFDNMEDRPIKGTSDWKKYTVVLNVPENAYSLKFGFMLAGKGSSWFNQWKLEPVADDMPITGKPMKPMEIPRPEVMERPNLEFKTFATK